MPDSISITAGELKRLYDELDRLKRDERRRLRQELATARAFGDFRENAEYDEAKRFQGTLEGRILELEAIIGRAQVVDAAAAGVVAVGADVIACDLDDQDHLTLCVRVLESGDEDGFLVTPDSPLGRQLMGRREGDAIAVETPSGRRRYAIVSISFAAPAAPAGEECSADPVGG